MSYSVINPPFTLKFREMSGSELKEYMKWFAAILPSRIDELSRAVRDTPGFETWQADFSRKSLEPLGVWFAMQVEIRPRSAGEIEDIANHSSLQIDIPGEELSNRTFSLAMDIGMYLSQVMLANHPALRWHQPLDKKQDIDFGQPVLLGFGRVAFNPVRMLVTLAYGLASGTRTAKGLCELYDIWTGMIR